MNLNELKTLKADIEKQLATIDAQVEKHIEAGNHGALEILHDTFEATKNRLDDVEERIEAAKRQTVKASDHRAQLASANID